MVRYVCDRCGDWGRNGDFLVTLAGTRIGGQYAGPPLGSFCSKCLAIIAKAATPPLPVTADTFSMVHRASPPPEVTAETFVRAVRAVVWSIGDAGPGENDDKWVNVTARLSTVAAMGYKPPQNVNDAPPQ